MWSALVDLVLPTRCAGCRAGGVPLRSGVCAACARLLEGLVPAAVAPRPGVPHCVALGPYGGVLRESLLAYKEHGRHGLAPPLGALLAAAALAVAESTVAGSRSVPCGAGAPRIALVPVPSTARAARERHGDHVLRLARHAAERLRRVGVPAAVARPLAARPRPDSAGLDAAARSAAAATAFRLRRPAASRLAAARPAVIIVDDVLTTGATLGAAHAVLAAVDIPVAGAAVLAETLHKSPREPAGSGRTAPVSALDHPGTPSG